jgi:WD40 repeat protein
MSTETKPIAFLTAEDTKVKEVKDGKDTKVRAPKVPSCTSLTWNCLGKKLFAGFSDGNIRVWHIKAENK